ncbi:MAG: poly-gamma-glutamate hydrolase family protein [Kiloniellales bacterium]
MNKTADAKSYRSFSDLANAQVRGIDYEIIAVPRDSRVAVIAPHGGAIEAGTSGIARAISCDDFSLYLFEGIKRSGNFRSLHLSSRYFDEPQCLNLIAKCEFVVAIHGCRGVDEKVLLGGLDAMLKGQIADALSDVGLAVETEGHQFPAVDPNNICNRGASHRGAQLELTSALRRSASAALVVSAVRSVLLPVHGAPHIGAVE